jgi:hypothetical protein
VVVVAVQGANNMVDIQKLVGGLGRGFEALTSIGASEMRRINEQKQLDQQAQLANILAGQTIPQFARAGGAEPSSAEEIKQAQLAQLANLAGQGNKEALNIIAKQSPLMQEAATPMTDLAKLKADEVAGFITPEQAEQERQARTVKREREGEQFKLEQDKFNQTVKEFNQKLKGGGLDPKDVFDTTQKLRKEFTGLSGEFIKQRDAFGRVAASAENPSAAGDLALIFNYMKILDPASVVRESEFAQAARTGAYGERIQAQVNKVLEGQRLSDGMRKDFVDRANKLFSKAQNQQDKRVRQYTKLAEKSGLSPEDVALDLNLVEAEAAPNDGVVITNPTTGEKLILRNGAWQPI